MAPTTLYVWRHSGVSSWGIFKHLQVDHAWVTDYLAPPCTPFDGRCADGPGDDPATAGGGFSAYPTDGHRYWANWSSPGCSNACRCNPNPGHYFRKAVVDDISKVTDICNPNNHSDTAGLGPTWGVNGTCQQVTNRILWPARPNGLGFHKSCAGVKAWVLSYIAFGPYGKTPWPPADQMDNTSVFDIDRHMQDNGVSDRDISTVLGMRTDFQQQIEKYNATIDPLFLDRDTYADRINSMMADFLEDIQGVLNDQQFIDVFDGPYDKQEMGKYVVVLDPSH